MVIADKPAEVWRDEDRYLFEANLAVLAQKFLNLHHLIAKVQAAGNGKFAARLISITNADGSETREVIWADAAELKHVERLKIELEALAIWQELPLRIKQAALAELLQTSMTTSQSIQNPVASDTKRISTSISHKRSTNG